MKKLYPSFILIFVCILFTSFTFGANTNISGIVNSYAVVNAVGANSITVGAFSPSYTPSCGDRIMIIQMKGASITTANSASFGNITNVNNAGNYEVVTIESVTGSTLTFTSNIGSYTVSGSVQAVHVPHYEDATVTGSITATSWNGSIGGVIAFEADGTITLNNGIDASSQGFSGGNHHLTTQASPSASSCFGFFTIGNVGTQWVYNNANRAFAVEKGESIINYADIWGKGKLATGGGGGGVESGGGGGGSNYGTGGNAGGGNPLSTPFCGGSPDVAGKGGAALSASIPGGKIFLGGGSGAGNNGNTNAYFGGVGIADAAVGHDGGGIVYIGANEIVGNGQSILANGEDGYTPPASINNFGGSGGGAGGSVLIDANIVTGTMTVEAKGGFGSSVKVTTTNARRRGAGGGGGGGIVWFSSASTPAGVTIDVSGGARGLSYYNTNVLSPSHYGTAGGNGASLTGLSVNGSVYDRSGLVSSTTTVSHVLNLGSVMFSDNGIIASVNTNGNNLGSTTATVTTGSTGPFAGSVGCTLDEHYMPRVYEIVPTTQPTTSVDVSLYVTQAELTSFIALTNGLGAVYTNCWGAVNSINDLIVTAHHSSGTKEVLTPTTSFLVCANAWKLDITVSEFSTFYIHSSGGLFASNLLPVELLEFEASALNDKTNILNWKTATEVNNDGFEVLRSLDGVNFDKIAWVEGNGNSNSINTYSFEDEIPDFKENVSNIYYQLKQIDFNKEFEYSEIEVVDYHVIAEKIEVKVFPNPAEDYVQIQTNQDVIEEVQFFDAMGRLIYRENGEISNNSKINIDFLNPGAYFLRIITDGGVVTSKLQVSH